MPYLTPDEIPEEDACRPLLIPASTDWLAIVSGALTELVKTYNWEQQGSVTVEQAVARMQVMIDQYYEDICNDCTLPEGERVIRIGAGGHFEELRGGEWIAPEGDYEVPPVPEREETTPEERRCLAAANAENVLAVFYEELSDAFSIGTTAAEALLAFGVAIGIAIAPPLGLLGAAVLAIGTIAFQEFFSFLDFLTEDVWTNDFSEDMRCMLYECSTDTDGVVTFNYECVVAKLMGFPTAFDWTFTEIRLAAQVRYMLSVIGVDGLNLAGATTAITESDCIFCGTCESYTDDLQTAMGERTFIGGAGGCVSNNFACGAHEGTIGTYSSVDGRTGGGCVKSVVHSGSFNRASIFVDLGQDCLITQATYWTFTGASGAKSRATVVWKEDGSLAASNSSTAPVSGWVQSVVIYGTPPVGRYIVMFIDTNAAGGACRIDDIEVLAG